jgi:hypothetical protein
MLLKDKICPMAVFDVLRKMNPVRQIEAAELLINAYIFFRSASRLPSSRARISIRFSSRLLISTTPIGSAASKSRHQGIED